MQNDVMTILYVISFVIALAVSILFLPKSNKEKFGKVGKGFHDFLNFRHFIVTDILKFAYYFLTSLVVLLGFYVMFQGSDFVKTGLLCIFVGPVVVRLIFEFTMMFVFLVENVAEINRKMKNQNPEEPKPVVPVAPVASQPPVREAPSAPVVPPVRQTPSAPVVPPVQQKPSAPVVPPVQKTVSAPAAPAVPAAAPAVFCTNCGKKCEPGFKFCMSCGTPLD